MLTCGNALTPLIKSAFALPNALLSSYILRLLALSLSPQHLSYLGSTKYSTNTTAIYSDLRPATVTNTPNSPCLRTISKPRTKNSAHLSSIFQPNCASWCTRSTGGSFTDPSHLSHCTVTRISLIGDTGHHTLSLLGLQPRIDNCSASCKRYCPKCGI
jgi:hypothetical protein